MRGQQQKWWVVVYCGSLETSPGFNDLPNSLANLQLICLKNTKMTGEDTSQRWMVVQGGSLETRPGFGDLPNSWVNLHQISLNKPRNYPRPKLRLSHRDTMVKCRATSVAKIRH